MQNCQGNKIFLSTIKFKSQMITIFKMKMKKDIKVQKQKVVKECKIIKKKELNMNHLL